jgi:hypothetical protein
MAMTPEEQARYDLALKYASPEDRAAVEAYKAHGASALVINIGGEPELQSDAPSILEQQRQNEAATPSPEAQPSSNVIPATIATGAIAGATTLPDLDYNDTELMDNITQANEPKLGSTEWVKQINSNIPRGAEGFVNQETNPEEYKKLQERFVKGKEAHGQLAKVISKEGLTNLARHGIIPPSQATPDMIHTSVEPVGLYTVDRSGYRHLSNLLTGGGENDLNSLTKFRDYLRSDPDNIGGEVAKIAMDPNAKILDASNPMHWLGHLDQFGRDLEKVGKEGDKPVQEEAGKLLQKGTRDFVEGKGRSLFDAFWQAHTELEQSGTSKADMGKLYEYLTREMPKDLTDHLIQSYDAVKFPDVVIQGQHDMPQVVLMNKGKAVMKVGKTFMPLGLVLGLASALVPDQVAGATPTHIDPQAAANHEKEMKKVFDASSKVDTQSTLAKPYKIPEGPGVLGQGEEALFNDPKQASAALEITARSFMHGLLPVDLITNQNGFVLKDAVHNANIKAAIASGMDPRAAEGLATAMEVGGSFVSVGGLFKLANAGTAATQAWAASKLLPGGIPIAEGWQELTTAGKAARLGAKAVLSAAVGITYEGMKDELKTAKQVAKTGGLWAGTDLVLGGMGPAGMYMMAGSVGMKNWIKNASVRDAAWEGICKVFEKTAGKIPMDWAFQGKYGPTLLHYFQGASVRLVKTEEGSVGVKALNDMLTNKMLTEIAVGSHTVRAGKELDKIPRGRELLYNLMKIDPSDKLFWDVIDKVRGKYGNEAAEILLTERAASRGMYKEAGKAGTEAIYKESEVKGPRVWMPKPDAVREYSPTGPIGEGKAFFTGYEGATDNPSYNLKFAIEKDGVIQNVEIKSNREFKRFTKKYDIINKDNLKASGKWNRTISYKDEPLLKMETYIKRIETYVPEVFTKRWKDLPADAQLYYQKFQHEATMVGKQQAAQMMGASIARFLKNNNLPEDLVKMLEPITDMTVLDHNQLINIWNAVHTARALDSISKLPTICKSPQDWAMAMANPPVGFNPKDWIRMPNDPDRYMKLAGRYLHKDMLLELETIMPSADSKGMIERAWAKWKGWKTTYSLKQHVRNTESNIILNATVGKYSMPPWGDGWTAYKDMAEIMHNPEKVVSTTTEIDRAKYGDVLPHEVKVLGKDIIKQMQDNNLFVGGFEKTDLQNIKPAMDVKVSNIFDYMRAKESQLGSKLGNYFNAEEQWAKGSKFLYLTRKGVDPKEAAEEAMKSTFNYSDVPLFIKDLRSKPWGSPFATFTYKVVPAMMETAIKYPWRIAAIEGALYTYNSLMANALHIGKEEWDKLKAKLPDYMQTGHYSPLPVRDDKGRLQWMNTDYLLPWGFMSGLRADFGANQSGGRISNLVQTIWNNPIASTISNAFSNQKFGGAPIVNSFDSTPMAIAHELGYLWEQAVPSLMIGGSDFKSILDTVQYPEGEKTLNWKQQIAKQVGINIKPMSEEQIKRQYYGRKKADSRDIRSELMKTLRQTKDPDQRSEARKKAQERLKDLLSQ